MKNRKYYLLKDFQAVGSTLDSIVAGWLESTPTPTAQQLAKMLVLAHEYDAIMYIDWISFEEDEPQQINAYTSDTFAEVKNKMRYIYQTTYDKYKVLLDAYTNEKANLLDKVKATNKTKFNDTPQADETGLDGDNYVSTYTIQESEVGFEIIDRLAKVQTLFMNVLNEWCKEFSNMFMKV